MPTRIAALAAAVTLVFAAGAQAATRYASSTSATTTGACDTPASACKLSYALSGATPSDTVRLLSDGTYVLDATMSTTATSVSGDPAQPRPVITDPSNTYTAIVGSGQTWRHLDFRVLTTDAGTLDDSRIAVVLTAYSSAAIVSGTLTSSQVSATPAPGQAGKVAISSSTGASVRGVIATATGTNAVGIDAGGGATTLRGVTAIATGTGSVGLRVFGTAFGIGGPPPDFCVTSSSGNVDAVDAILRGDTSDIAENFSAPCIGGTPPSVRLRSSNFRADHVTNTGGGSIDTSDAANQTTAALTDPAAIFVDFAGGNYHERAGAPTIDAGSGLDMPTFDADGEQRLVGAATDIGGDESQLAAVAGGAASNLTTTGATLSAAASTADGASSIVFEYGTTTAYGSATPAQALTARTVQQPSAAVTGLAPATTYHFHAVATTTSNGATRTVTGPDVTFTTPAAPSGGGGGGGGTTTTPAFVAKGLTAPGRFSRRTLGRLGLTVHLQIGALGSKIKASLFSGGVKVRAAAATPPVATKTITVSGTVTLKLKPSKSALRRLRTAKKLTLVVTVTPPAGSASAPVTLTKTITLTA